MDIRPPWWGLAGMTTVVLTSLPAHLTTPPGGFATAPPTAHTATPTPPGLPPTAKIHTPESPAPGRPTPGSSTSEGPAPESPAAAPSIAETQGPAVLAADPVAAAVAAAVAATPAATPATVTGSLGGTVGAQAQAASGTTANGSAANVRLAQPDAMRLLQAAGLGWRSSGHCTDPQRRECTSLSSIRYGTLTQTIELKRASKCMITITGGTEVGHSRGYYSHQNGFKVDIDHNKCIDAYITGTFRFWKTRGDGAALYCPWLFPGLPPPPDTDIYADEPSHWDILYR
ncbi:hypothetical protein N5079_33715 [Planotetraspora sp. A-T 1434]|uniref:hypothetical protein n=1 Tax=Planotetraspora sp. A-T 1434 TaxID=2979219 RepID=UPI0021C0E083|nr:hypothetical protein [Planotetraspora sp. A-T 1434]MCT9935172.1 hypothetical protein [Planotetraspora sp. A-T 1434]